MKFGCTQCETVRKWLHDVKLMPPALWPCQIQIKSRHAVCWHHSCGDLIPVVQHEMLCFLALQYA